MTPSKTINKSLIVHHKVLAFDIEYKLPYEAFFSTEKRETEYNDMDILNNE
jgi:hypothetical protein